MGIIVTFNIIDWIQLENLLDSIYGLHKGDIEFA
jgi:hypothetical protein